MNDKSKLTLEERVGRIEDYIAIQQLISSYGPAADACNEPLLKEIWAEDAVYDARNLAYLEGEEIFEGIRHAFHQSLVAAGSAHTSTMPHIVLNGDEASATHYAALYKHNDGRWDLLRLIGSRWLLRRTAAGWRVYRRTNRVLNGEAEARRLLSRVTDAPHPSETESDVPVDKTENFSHLPKI